MNMRIATTVALAALAVGAIAGASPADAAPPAAATHGTSNTLNFSWGISNTGATSLRGSAYTFEDVLITP